MIKTGASSGDSDALYWLGEKYLWGSEKVHKDFSIAREFFEKSHKKNVSSMYILSLLLRYCKKIENIERSISLCESAASKNYLLAIVDLSICHEKGYFVKLNRSTSLSLQNKISGQLKTSDIEKLNFISKKLEEGDVFEKNLELALHLNYYSYLFGNFNKDSFSSIRRLLNIEENDKEKVLQLSITKINFDNLVNNGLFEFVLFHIFEQTSIQEFFGLKFVSKKIWASFKTAKMDQFLSKKVFRKTNGEMLWKG